jgi:hypothetical protein
MAEIMTDLPEAFATQPIQYLSRTRAWYSALGYEPYRWPHLDDIAFTSLSKPLSESRLGLVTTAAPYQPDKGDQGPGAAYNGSAKFFDVYTSPVDDPADVRISHIGYDRVHTSADDPNTWFPLPRLTEAVAAGRIGGLTARFYGAPTVRRIRSTTEEHAPQIVAALQADGADVALLVPT